MNTFGSCKPKLAQSSWPSSQIYFLNTAQWPCSAWESFLNFICVVRYRVLLKPSRFYSLSNVAQNPHIFSSQTFLRAPRMANTRAAIWHWNCQGGQKKILSLSDWTCILWDLFICEEHEASSEDGLQQLWIDPSEKTSHSAFPENKRWYLFYDERILGVHDVHTMSGDMLNVFANTLAT